LLLPIVAVLGAVGAIAWSADQFVLGAARVALIRKVPSLVVGVVIVGFGTSAPELLVSALAAGGGESEIAIGNIVGSNVANLSLLLGIGAMMVPLAVDSMTVRREGPLVLAAVAVFAILVQGGGITRFEGLAMIVAMLLVLLIVSRRTGGDPLADDVVELADPAAHRLGRETLRTIVGLIGTVGAAQLLLWGALEIASQADLAEGFVGATMVAVGTSLPELVTVVQSARRRETDLIIGNLLGSNLFNALAVGGVVGLIGAPEIDAPALTTVAVAASVVVATLAFVAMVTKHTVSRKEGVVLVLAYAAMIPFLA
jgi:cation:H+ antiporter